MSLSSDNAAILVECCDYRNVHRHEKTCARHKTRVTLATLTCVLNVVPPISATAPAAVKLVSVII